MKEEQVKHIQKQQRNKRQIISNQKMFLALFRVPRTCFVDGLVNPVVK